MFERLCLALSSVTFLGLGLAFFVDPVFFGSLVEISLPTPAAKIELSTFYGGLEIALGVFLLACLFTPHYLRAGLLLQTMLFGFCSVSRLVGIFRFSGGSEIIYWLFLSEILFALASYRALLLNDRRSRSA